MKRFNILWKLGVAFIAITVLSLVIWDYFDNLSSAGYLKYIYVTVLVIVLSGGAAWIFVNHFIRRPIGRLSDGMDRLAEKEFDFRLDEDDKNDFGSLAASFNDMASMLSASLSELQKNQDYLEGILESSADIIITVNASGNIQTINSGAEKTLGYKRAELFGKPIEMLFADPQERAAAINRLKFGDSVVNYETRFVTKNKEIRNVLLTISRLRNPSGEIIGTIGISKDITREKRLQKELIQSQRFAAIGQVFVGLQHSMKNMLNALKGGSYMVRSGLAKDNRKMLTEGWEIVQEGITRLTELSMDMLKFVKDRKPKYAHVDLKQTLSDINRVISKTADNKGVEFRMDLSPDLPMVSCDSGMIHTAVMDIVSNALDACLWKEYGDREIPEVALNAYPAPDEKSVIIEVKDNGCGMTEEVKANIFTPFFSTKSKAGTGLGLSITSRMIDAHHGKIDVESEPDRGTVFHIVLPIDGTKKSEENIDGQKGSGSR